MTREERRWKSRWSEAGRRTRRDREENIFPNKDGVTMGKKAKARNSAQIAKGKLKETAGKATGDHNLESEGDLDQLKGNVKQASEKAKDALKN
jgi:uncharacterized protein YjbJ (UPF0337 family)